MARAKRRILFRFFALGDHWSRRYLFIGCVFFLASAFGHPGMVWIIAGGRLTPVDPVPSSAIFQARPQGLLA